MLERVVAAVVLVLPGRAEADRVDDRRRRRDEGDLHKGVVQAVEMTK